MPIRAADATFDVTSFTWGNGAFELRGRWQDADELGRVRLLVDIGGRRKNLGAQGGRLAEDGPDWGARFICMTQPDADGFAALQVSGRTIELPTPVVAAGTAPAPAPPPPPAPTTVPEPVATPPATDDVRGAEALLQQLRAERQALDKARDGLARERRAAEEAIARLAQARERPALPARRPAQLRSREQLTPEELDYTPIYWVAGTVAFLFLLVLIWIF
jgi:hypothetical protein